MYMYRLCTVFITKTCMLRLHHVIRVCTFTSSWRNNLSWLRPNVINYRIMKPWYSAMQQQNKRLKTNHVCCVYIMPSDRRRMLAKYAYRLHHILSDALVHVHVCTYMYAIPIYCTCISSPLAPTLHLIHGSNPPAFILCFAGEHVHVGLHMYT